MILLENLRFHVEEEGKGLDAAGKSVRDTVARFDKAVSLETPYTAHVSLKVRFDAERVAGQGGQGADGRLPGLAHQARCAPRMDFAGIGLHCRSLVRRERHHGILAHSLCSQATCTSTTHSARPTALTGSVMRTKIPLSATM